MSQLACWNCKDMTYRCLKCAKPVCNRSSSCHVAASEDEPGWKAGHCVAFCVPCSACSRESSEIATESIQSTSSSSSSSSNSSSAKPSKNEGCNPSSNRTCLTLERRHEIYSLRRTIPHGSTESSLKCLVLAKPKYKAS